MKKYIFMLTAVIAVMLASCSNDDIPMNQTIAFKVNPSTVVSNLYEFSAGELSSIGSAYQLSVTMYLYNDAGTLIEKRNQRFSDYTHVMNEQISVGQGQYTLVATTLIVGKSDGFNYWTVSGEDNLSTFSIQDAGYIGGRYKILGLSASKISIGASTQDVSIDVKPAGAIALVRWTNWNKYSDVESWALMSNRSCDNLVLDNNANVHYSVESSSDYDWYVAAIDYDSDYQAGYAYAFLFPMQNAKMSFAAETSTSQYLLGTTLNSDIELGKSYLFMYDVDADETYWYDMTNSRGVQSLPQQFFNLDAMKVASDEDLATKQFGFPN
jgi:hypothetical protein